MLLLQSIDIKVFQTFEPCDCVPIWLILCILLQTAERVRGTGPRATGGTPDPVEQEYLVLPDGDQAIAI